MRTILRQRVLPVVMFFIMIAVVVSLALADQPGQSRRRGPIRSVAEPATIVLLGAGLAGVGFYALKKRKKQ